MLRTAVLGRFIPRNIGVRIADYIRTKSSDLTHVIRRRFSTEVSRAPKPLKPGRVAPARQLSTQPAGVVKGTIHPRRMFTTGASNVWQKKIFPQSTLETPIMKAVIQPKGRSFSTDANTKMWEKIIKKDPEYLHLNYVKDLTPEKINDLISLIEKNGPLIDVISLPLESFNKEKLFNKETLQKLFQAIGKWQPVLPGFSVVNVGAFHQVKYFFNPSVSHLKECENLLKTLPTKFGFYEMQKVSLNDRHFINELSEHIVNVNSDHSVYIVLKDNGMLTKPPINPLTGEPDFSPITRTIEPKLSIPVED